MSDEAIETSEIPKKRSLLKIILIVLLTLIVLGGVVAGTLFAAGFFDSEGFEGAEDAIAAMQEAENSDKLKDVVESDEPQDKNKDTAEGELAYFEMKPELLSNLYNSQRMIQVQIAVMVKENDDKTLVEEIKRHSFPMRSSLLEILSQKREDQVSTLGFRDNLRAQFKEAINDVLEKRTGSRHIQELYLTEFIVQ
jgi:flagellar basal body-associated protein FliL|tara:strand:+ start:772 stop:1356 length:585 start_codon:yes stop_codon:yes gene_type:complete